MRIARLGLALLPADYLNPVYADSLSNLGLSKGCGTAKVRPYRRRWKGDGELE
jgi:hypothetical protein